MAPRVRFLSSHADARAARSVRMDEGCTLHDAVCRAGLPIASACGADGICGRCAVEVVSGGEQLSVEQDAETRVKRRNRVPAAQRLACRATVRGDVTIRAGYW